MTSTFAEGATIETPRATQTAGQLTAVIRTTIQRAEIQAVMGPGVSEVMATVAATAPEPGPHLAGWRTELNPPLV